LPEAVQRFDTSARHRSLVSDSLLVRDPMRIEAQQSGRALAPMQRRRLRSPQRRRPPTSAFWATLTGNTDPLLPSSAVTIVSAHVLDRGVFGHLRYSLRGSMHWAWRSACL